MKKFGLIFLFAFLLIVPYFLHLAATSQRNLELIRKPYLQTVLGDSAVVVWKTKKAVSCAVRYGVDYLDFDQMENGVVFSDDESGFYNKVVLHGLKEGKKYYYSVITDGVDFGKDSIQYLNSYKGDSANNFSFFAMGDIGPDPLIGFQKQTAKQIVNQGYIDFGLGLGDIIYPDGSSQYYDQNIFEPLSKVLIHTPFYPALGNHDWRSTPEENFAREWFLPNNEHYYSFRYGNALFIALDSRNGGFYKHDEQIKWLKKQLKNRSKEIDWVIVYLHHNGKTCTYKTVNKKVVALYPMFSKYGVDLILNGHAHTYERLRPLYKGWPIETNGNDNSYYNLDSCFVSVTSGAGGTLRKGWKPGSSCEDGLVAKTENVGHFSLVKIEGKNLFFKAIDSFTGDTIDYFQIKKN